MEDCRINYFKALYEVAATVNSTLSLGEVLQNTARSTAKAMNAKACVLRLLDRKRDVLDLSASYGLTSEYLGKGPVEVEKSRIDREALEGRVVTIRDVAVDPRFQYPAEAKREGIVSVLALPLCVRGTNIGVIRVYTADEHEFTSDEIDFLSAVANLSAIAIENAKVYEALHEQFQAIRKAKVPWAENFDKPYWRD